MIWIVANAATRAATRSAGVPDAAAELGAVVEAPAALLVVGITNASAIGANAAPTPGATDFAVEEIAPAKSRTSASPECVVYPDPENGPRFAGENGK